MKYDVIVIGAGLSGLSAASLLAKRGIKTAVIEHANTPGGSCGIFKRQNAIFDQGAAMLYGFGEHGFNAHRFLFNCLQEPIQMIKHELLYTVHYRGRKIHFHADIDRFVEELSAVFPTQRKNIRKFYKEMQKCYLHVISEIPSYTTPDETNPKEALRNVLKHPLSYFKFLSYLNISADKLLRQYFNDPEILHFFDKLTSTYCYATLEEAPAILASVMFIDNHVGGSFYPAGSTLFLPGKLEKVIEENNGEIRYESTVTKLLVENEKIQGVTLETEETLYANQIIYSGTVWNLYHSLLPSDILTEKEVALASQIPTYPSVALYALVNASVIPPDTCPIEMLATNPDAIDESEVTVYISSLDDHTLCPPEQHTIVAIGPSFREWNPKNTKQYKEQKEEEISRLVAILEQRFPGFADNILFTELATPHTIERYTLKNGGAAAGPKQMLGQHMLLRQPIRTRFENLYCCGESTTMGTGTTTVTISGIAAANAILKKRGLKPYIWQPDMKNYVQVMQTPVQHDWLAKCYPTQEAQIMQLAGKCQYCSNPSCCQKAVLDIPGIMRRTTCGNFTGAKKLIQNSKIPLSDTALIACEKNCIQSKTPNSTVAIKEIIKTLQQSI